MPESSTHAMRCKERDNTLATFSSYRKTNGPGNTTYLHIHVQIDDGLERVAIALLLIGPARVRLNVRVAVRFVQIDLPKGGRNARAQSWQGHQHTLIVVLAPHRHHIAWLVAMRGDVDVLGRKAGKVDRIAVDPVHDVAVLEIVRASERGHQHKQQGKR